MRPQYGIWAPPETGYPCPICGDDVAWWREPYEKIGDDVYHESCLERVMEAVDPADEESGDDT